MELNIDNQQIKVLKLHRKLSKSNQPYVYNLNVKVDNILMQDLLDKNYIEVIKQDDNDNVYTSISLNGIIELDNINRYWLTLTLKSIYFPIIVSIITSVITSIISFFVLNRLTK